MPLFPQATTKLAIKLLLLLVFSLQLTEVLFVADKFGAAFTLVKSDIGGNISVSMAPPQSLILSCSFL